MEESHFDQLLSAAVNAGASDIHLKVGSPFTIRDGENLVTVTDEPLTRNDIENVVANVLKSNKLKSSLGFDPAEIDSILDYDTSFSAPNIGRFRVNICRQRGTLAVAMRVIPTKAPEIDALLLPEVIKNIAVEARGLVLVTGVSGAGKSTTLAAMVNHVNHSMRRKVITIEDPIEYLISDNLSTITQREVGVDSENFSTALRAALRQDTDLIMVGEMRDRETVEIALKAAETGHLVMSTAHTSDTEGSISRLLGVFHPGEQAVNRLRLADTLKAIISQRLVPLRDSDGRVAAVEVMRMTSSIRERILTSDPRGFHDLIEQGWNPHRMQTFDQHLTELYKKELISIETALAAATSQIDFKRNLQFEG